MFFGGDTAVSGASIWEHLDWAHEWPAQDPQRAMLRELLGRLERPAARLLLARCTGLLRPPREARICVRRLDAAGAVARVALGSLELPAQCEDSLQLEVRVPTLDFYP